MTDHDPMDARLREYADRWRESAAATPAVETERLGRARRPRTLSVVVGTAAAIALVIFGATRLVDSGAPAELAPPVETPSLSATAPASPSLPAHPLETAPAPAQRKAAVHAGVPVIQGFLDTYRRDGIVVAARKYLPADSQPDSAVGVPRLTSGSVVSAAVSSWESADRFTLDVGLDLHFDGDPGAWNEGHNDRFVTFTRSDGALRLTFATSP